MNKGFLFVALGAICFSAKAILIKLAYSSYQVQAIDLLTLRFLYALPFFLVIAFIRFQKGAYRNLSLKEWLTIAVLSLLGYYWASWFDFKGLVYISAGLERIILFIYPTLVVLFSRIFLQKKISKTVIYALVITYAGMICITTEPRIFQSSNFLLGASMIFVSAVTYALYLVFGGEQIKKYGSVNFNSISMIFSSVFVLMHFSLLGQTKLINLPLNVHFYGLALAIISTVIPTFLVMEGIKILGASKASVVASIGPISTIILAYVFLNETLSLQEAAGSSLVILGVVLIGKEKPSE